MDCLGVAPYRLYVDCPPVEIASCGDMCSVPLKVGSYSIWSPAKEIVIPMHQYPR